MKEMIRKNKKYTSQSLKENYIVTKLIVLSLVHRHTDRQKERNASGHTSRQSQAQAYI